MKKHVSVNKLNTVNETFGVFFAERLYAGAPRWFADESEWRAHAGNHFATDREAFDREASVREAIKDCHAADPISPAQHDWWFQTCSNTDCPTREQWGAQRSALNDDNAVAVNRKIKVTQGLRLFAQSKKPDPLTQSEHVCDQCGEAKHTYPIKEIQDKWIYVLKQTGKSVRFYAEIHAQDPNARTGSIYLLKGNGDRKGKGGTNRLPFRGHLRLAPDPTAFTWSFFLSPVPLGKKAKELLREVVTNPITAHKPAEHARTHWIALYKKFGIASHKWQDIDRQPWSPVVTLKITPERVANKGVAKGLHGTWEVVPLVDPFAWVAQAVETDYLPVLATKLKMVRDSNEQAKAFVAASLAQAAGRRITDPNAHPVKWEEDPFEITKETVAVPKGEAGTNAATAWMNRYRSTMKYLTEQTNAACTRVVLPIRFGLGHRIVELACQEAAHDAPDDFALGLAHWHHVLQQLPACADGRAFMAWLGDGGDGVHAALAAAERMPAHNVLAGVDIGGNTALATRIGGLAVQLYGLLAPVVIATSSADDAAGTVVDQLVKLGVPVTHFGAKDIMSTGKWAIAIPDSLIDGYGARVVGAFTSDPKLDKLKVESFKGRLTTFQNVKEFHGAVTMFLALKDYGKSPGREATNYDRHKATQALVQAPIDIASFITKNSRRLLKARIQDSAALKIIESADELTPQVKSLLEKGGYGKLLASRSVRAYDLLGKVSKGISGPVGLVMGGSDIVINGGAAVGAWRSQNPGVAVGHGIQVAAGVMIVAVAATECAALLTGAAAASWAGPVGWVAAGMMLVGAAVVTVWSKEDLQLFARYSFLGKRYGDAGVPDFDQATGKCWMGHESWAALRYGSQADRVKDEEASYRFLRQRLALLRLMSGFRTWHGPLTHGGPGAGVEIWPTHIDHSTNSRFEVEINIREKGRVNPVESYRADVWPLARDWRWRSKKPKADWVRFYTGDGSEVTSFQVYVEPSEVAGPYWVETRVRMRFEALGAYLPASRSHVYNGNFVKGKEMTAIARYAPSDKVF